MPDRTSLEMQEEKLAPMFGGAQSIGLGDSKMLEMSDTNRWIYSAEQSELMIAWRMMHDALVAHDNRTPEYRRYHDEQTGQWQTRRITVDNWKWMLDIEYLVKTNQLTIGAFSRFQHLRQIANMTGIVETAEKNEGLFGWING